VYRNPFKEIGWFPIQTVPTAESVFSFPPECIVFQWHGETFDLPKGSVRLAQSVACENQAFQLMNNVIGLQFHLEVTPKEMSAFVRNCRDELVPGPFVQCETDLLAALPNAYNTINSLMNEILSYLTRSVV
jgi:GMP synthase-like glutamine amidotransferase